MKCELIARSVPTVSDVSTAEELVAYCARVSNPANQNNKESAAKLVNYLMKNDHWSPFEMVHLTISVETTRDIARQMLRHRSFAFQEFSQRYAEVVDFAAFREARMQDHKNRQNSIETDNKHVQWRWNLYQRAVLRVAEFTYKSALKLGVAKEVARAVLPEGLTNSTLYMSGSLRSWIHYCQLRRGNGTQLEHKEIADACWAIIGKEFPSIAEALNG